LEFKLNTSIMVERKKKEKKNRKENESDQKTLTDLAWPQRIM
jgi:hypothetical protein